jgi:hypothetical protein
LISRPERGGAETFLVPSRRNIPSSERKKIILSFQKYFQNSRFYEKRKFALNSTSLDTTTVKKTFYFIAAREY